MKVTKERAEINRLALLDAAARLFKEHGVDGVGIAEICKAAGLTHGALYSHFSDKEDLVAQAFAHDHRRGARSALQLDGKETQTLASYLDRYLSKRVRDERTVDCPVVALASDAGRQGEAVSESFTAGLLELRSGLQAAIEDQADGAAKSTLIVAALVGAMAISRGIVKTDASLANEVLDLVRAGIEGVTGPLGPER